MPSHCGEPVAGGRAIRDGMVFLTAQIVRCGDRLHEMILPDAIDHDPHEQRILSAVTGAKCASV